MISLIMIYKKIYSNKDYIHGLIHKLSYNEKILVYSKKPKLIKIDECLGEEDDNYIKYIVTYYNILSLFIHYLTIIPFSILMVPAIIILILIMFIIFIIISPLLLTIRIFKGRFIFMFKIKYMFIQLKILISNLYQTLICKNENFIIS
jgi:hypothetical protein